VAIRTVMERFDCDLIRSVCSCTIQLRLRGQLHGHVLLAEAGSFEVDRDRRTGNQVADNKARWDAGTHQGPRPRPTSSVTQKQQTPAITIQVDQPQSSTTRGSPRFRNRPDAGASVAVMPKARATPWGLMLSAVSE